MPVQSLVLYPDPRLRRPCGPVTAFDAALRALARDIEETLLAVAAIGLTAAHVGVLQRVAAIRMTPDAATRIYVNPVVAWASPETLSHEEGSVSMPGIGERVERPARVRIRFDDLDGAPREEAADGFAAAVLLHEIDQLDGVFWIERLSRLKRDRAIKRFAKARSPADPA